MNERYREAAAHVVNEGVIMSTCATCKVAMEALSKLATGEWVLCDASDPVEDKTTAYERSAPTYMGPRLLYPEIPELP